MPHVGHAISITNDPFQTYPIKTPQTRHSSQQDNFTKPSYFIFLMHDHSFIHSHTRIHAFIHTVIHSSHTSEASHMWLNASQRSMLRHEVEVASFDMSNDLPGFEGRPTKGSRPPRVKQS